jgi:hypothetical protein
MEAAALPTSGQVATHVCHDKLLYPSDTTMSRVETIHSTLKNETTISINDTLNLYPRVMRNGNPLQKPELPPPVNTHKMTTTISILEALKLIPADFYKLPPLAGGNSVLRSLRWRVGSTYRKLFAIVWLSNMIALGIYCYHHFRNGMSVKDQNAQIMVLEDLQTAVAANLLAAISLRNEHVVNFLYRIFITNTPASRPLWLRRLLAKLYCYGGVHSGCGISAASWYLLLTVAVMFNQPPSKVHARLLSGLSIIIVTLLTAMIVCAMPYIRTKAHNLFELVHRFVGWSIQGLVWVQVVAFTFVVAEVRKERIGFILVKLPAFWFLCAVFGFTLYPWLRLRRVKVRIDKLSNDVVRIWFDGRTEPARTIRVSNRPTMESHAFATIPAEMGFSSIITNAGDWTKRLIANPPEKVWVRGVYAWGVIRVSTLFKRIVVVTTGSGIGPCLSLFTGYPHVLCRVLWSTRTPGETYGEKVLDTVLRADPNAFIIDTKDKGRQDMVQLSYSLYRESNAEAVIVISNPTLTYKVVFGLESRGIPAFGPIWDS